MDQVTHIYRGEPSYKAGNRLWFIYQFVTIVRPLDAPDEFENLGDPMYRVRADDGWTGDVWESELTDALGALRIPVIGAGDWFRHRDRAGPTYTYGSEYQWYDGRRIVGWYQHAPNQRVGIDLPEAELQRVFENRAMWRRAER